MSEEKTPDWDFWRSMRKAQEWQACALSLNIDPDSMKHHPQNWMGDTNSGPFFTSDSFPSNDVQMEFEKRFRLLRANRHDRALFTQSMAKHSSLGPNEVFLSEFAAWGESIAWNDMPQELLAIAKPASLSPPPLLSVQPSPAISAEEWSALVAQDEEARKDPAYKIEYDRAMSLYDERDGLLEQLRQDHPYVDVEIKKRLSELRKQIAESEAGLGEPHGPTASAESTKQPTAQNTDAVLNAEAKTDQILAALFDPVTVEALEKMFPAADKWKNWAERAARNGLFNARIGRGLFNPYQAAFWFLTQGIAGWDIARVNRTLANNLPARSRHDGHLLTGDMD